MKVLLLSRYGHLGASSRYRSYQYLPYLRRQGFEITVSPLLNDKYVADLYAGRKKSFVDIAKAYSKRLVQIISARNYNLLWIEKEALPWLPAWIEHWLGLYRVPYVVDYDDAIFHRYDLHKLGLVKLILGRKIDRVMRRAALVVAGNEYLARRARNAGARKVEVIPTVIDLDKYPLAPSPENEVFTIGWIGSPGTAKYLSIITNALQEVCAGGSARVILIGSGRVDLPGVPVEYVPWSEKTEVAEMQRFDVGIMPLPDEPWERGKCGFKLIQYMACGRPVVGSPVGVNQKIIKHGSNGFQAGSNDEWVKALLALRNNQELRQKMGETGRKMVEEKYCLQVTAPRLAKLLHSVCR